MVEESEDLFNFQFEDMQLNFRFEGRSGNKVYNAKSFDYFDTNFMQTEEGYKWAHEFNLPTYDFKIRVYVDSNQPFDSNDTHLFPYGLEISFDDVVDEGYAYELFVINETSAYYEITKDWQQQELEKEIWFL